MEENNKEVVEKIEEQEPAFVNEEIQTTPLEENVAMPELEAHKNKFTKAYKISRMISYISSAIVIAIIVVAYTVIFPLQPNGTWAGIIVIIITLVGSVIFSRWHRGSITSRVRQYMSDYNGEVNYLALKDSKFANYSFDFAGEISADVFKKARFLKDIINTNSRNVMTYDVSGFKIEVADFVAYRQDGKQAKSAFLGKLIHGTTEQAIEGRVVFYLKPDPNIFKDAAGPDDIADLELLDDKPRYRLYASSKELKKKLPLRAINSLLAIRPNNELADLTLVMHDNKVLITLTYSDVLMVVPYKEAIPTHAIMAYKAHLTAINEFFSLL